MLFSLNIHSKNIIACLPHARHCARFGNAKLNETKLCLRGAYSLLGKQTRNT